MAILEGSIIGKAAVAIVGLAAGGFAAFNYVNTGCPLGTTCDAGAASVSLTADAAEDGMSCCPLGGGKAQAIVMTASNTDAGTCSESADSCCSADAKSCCATESDANVQLVSGTTETCSSSCAVEDAKLVGGEAEACSSTCTGDAAAVQLVSNTVTETCSTSCSGDAKPACSSEASVQLVSNTADEACVETCSAPCAEDSGSCEPAACEASECPAKIAAADAPTEVAGG